jgi:hypothetical protein
MDPWLAALPLADEVFGDGIVLNGRLLPDIDGAFRILSCGLCLSFNKEDVLRIEPALAGSPLERLPRNLSQVVIRHGAHLVDVRPAATVVRGRLQKRPFAIAARPSVIVPASSNSFRELEWRFLLAHGLLE